MSPSELFLQFSELNNWFILSKYIWQAVFRHCFEVVFGGVREEQPSWLNRD